MAIRKHITHEEFDAGAKWYTLERTEEIVSAKYAKARVVTEMKFLADTLGFTLEQRKEIAQDVIDNGGTYGFTVAALGRAAEDRLFTTDIEPKNPPEN